MPGFESGTMCRYEHEMCVCICMCVAVGPGWHWGVAAVSALVQSACLHGACCHTRLLFRKSLGLFIPPPAWAPAKELQAFVYLLVCMSVYGFTEADQPEICTHTHSHWCGQSCWLSQDEPEPDEPRSGPRQTRSTWGQR